jgi:hypothetical protein
MDREKQIHAGVVGEPRPSENLLVGVGAFGRDALVFLAGHDDYGAQRVEFVAQRQANAQASVAFGQLGDGPNMPARVAAADALAAVARIKADVHACQRRAARRGCGTPFLGAGRARPPKRRDNRRHCDASPSENP